MPETPAQRRAKGLYTMKELAAERAAKKAKQEASRKTARNTSIIKKETAKQKQGSMYKGKGSDIGITTSTSAKNTAKKKPAQKKVSTVKKGVKLKSTTPSVVNAQKKKTATTATKQSNRATRKTDKLRSKGQEALASGNLRKAKRLSDRSRRTAKRAIKTRK